jgi:hypothetical protein
MLGTKIIAACAATLSTCESCPAPLVMSRGVTPHATQARRTTSVARSLSWTGGRSRSSAHVDAELALAPGDLADLCDLRDQ